MSEESHRCFSTKIQFPSILAVILNPNTHVHNAISGNDENIFIPSTSLFISDIVIHGSILFKTETVKSDPDLLDRDLFPSVDERNMRILWVQTIYGLFDL